MPSDLRPLEELVTEPRMPFPGSLAASGGCPETNLCGGLVDMLSSLPRLGLAVEVGSFRGVSTEVLAHFADRVICVDPWAAWPRAKKEFDARFAAAQSVSYLRMTSVEAAGIVADGVADLVYIDAMHDRESVLRDIGAWLPKLRPGGWISGHDHDHAEQGVLAAVKEAFGGPDRVFRDSSWLVCPRPAVNRRTVL